MSTLDRWLSYVVLGQNPPRRKRRERKNPLRDWRYRAFIRTHSCVACGTCKGIECAHTGPHGHGIKAPDSDCIPLCWWHHWACNDCLHTIGPELFQKLHGIRIGTIVKELQAEWKELIERRRES